MTTAVVVALIGLPGAGKSVAAGHLVQALGLRRVCRDAIRAAMFPVCRWTLTEKRAAFRALRLALDVNCALGESSVIDGMTFSVAADLEAVAGIARSHGFAFVPVWLDVPPHVARERIAADLAAGPHPAGDRGPDLVDAVLQRFEAPPPGTPAVDATLPREALCAAVEAAVRAAMAAGDG